MEKQWARLLIRLEQHLFMNIVHEKEFPVPQ
jgi:hypothetical protein